MEKLLDIKNTLISNPNRLLNVVVVLAVIIIIIAIHHIYTVHVLCNKFLSGYWVADSMFCEESGVSSMLMFINKTHDIMYLVINNNITNQMVKMSCGGGFLGTLNSKVYHCVLEFEEDCGIPSDVSLDLNVADGVLRIHDEKTIYGIFYKDHEVSLMFSDENEKKVDNIVDSEED